MKSAFSTEKNAGILCASKNFKNDEENINNYSNFLRC